MSKILSAFLDEAGQERRWEPGAKWYLLTLVLKATSDSDTETEVCVCSGGVGYNSPGTTTA